MLQRGKQEEVLYLFSSFWGFWVFKTLGEWGSPSFRKRGCAGEANRTTAVRGVRLKNRTWALRDCRFRSVASASWQEVNPRRYQKCTSTCVLMSPAWTTPQWGNSLQQLGDFNTDRQAGQDGSGSSRMNGALGVSDAQLPSFCLSVFSALFHKHLEGRVTSEP